MASSSSIRGRRGDKENLMQKLRNHRLQKINNREIFIVAGYTHFRLIMQEVRFMFRSCQPIAQTPFRSLKRISDHSKVRFTANPKLALWSQTLGLLSFHFTKNGYQKFFNVRSRKFGQQALDG